MIRRGGGWIALFHGACPVPNKVVRSGTLWINSSAHTHRLTIVSKCLPRGKSWFRSGPQRPLTLDLLIKFFYPHYLLPSPRRPPPALCPSPNRALHFYLLHPHPRPSIVQLSIQTRQTVRLKIWSIKGTIRPSGWTSPKESSGPSVQRVGRTIGSLVTSPLYSLYASLYTDCWKLWISGLRTVRRGRSNIELLQLRFWISGLGRGKWRGEWGCMGWGGMIHSIIIVMWRTVIKWRGCGG